MEGTPAANWSIELDLGSGVPPGAEGNLTAGPPRRNEALARVEVAVLCLILFLALSGNACVLLALRTTRHKHSRLFFFMKHLSIADLVVAVFQVLPQLLWDITFRFYGPDLLCRLVKYLQVVGMFASTYLLLLMSLDRCLAICQPLRSLRRRTDRLAVLATWLGCLVASVPQVHIFSLREVADGVFDCWAVFIQPWGPKAYVTWITLAVYIVPVIVLAACYGLISFKIWQNLRLKTAAAAAAAEGSDAAGGAGRAALARVSSVKLISKAKIRTVKMTFIIVLAFIVCWTPFFFVQMWSVWDVNAPKEGSEGGEEEGGRARPYFHYLWTPRVLGSFWFHIIISLWWHSTPEVHQSLDFEEVTSLCLQDYSIEIPTRVQTLARRQARTPVQAWGNFQCENSY
jgi:hypothetical protein